LWTDYAESAAERWIQRPLVDGSGRELESCIEQISHV